MLCIQNVSEGIVDKLTEDIDKKDINWSSMYPYYSVCKRIRPPVAPFF